jgi:hypothetical protein
VAGRVKGALQGRQLGTEPGAAGNRTRPLAKNGTCYSKLLNLKENQLPPVQNTLSIPAFNVININTAIFFNTDDLSKENKIKPRKEMK